MFPQKDDFMNNNFWLKLIKSILRISFKTLIGLLKFVITVLLSDELRRGIKARKRRDNGYDQYTAQVTKRKYLH